MQEALLYALNFFLSKFLPGNCGNYDVKVRVRSAKAFSKNTYLGTVFVHNSAFPTATMTKIMKILILGHTISLSVQVQQSGPQCICKC